MIYKLKPFDGQNTSWDLSVQVIHQASLLYIDYLLSGDFGSIIMNPISPSSCLPRIRENELWRFTCFELFFSPRGSSEYWELNLAPHLNWNLYHFTSYRSTLREEPRIREIETDIRTENCKEQLCFAWRAKIDLSPLNLDHQPIEMNATAVIVSKLREQQITSFFAAKHAPDHPDFHHRQSFFIEV